MKNINITPHLPNVSGYAITILAFFFGIFNVTGQKITTQQDFQLNIKKAQQTIKIDGDLSEMDWQNAAIATNFQVHYPQNGAKPRFQTEARVTYDDHFMYVGFHLFRYHK
jgi:hypothetical protein